MVGSKDISDVILSICCWRKTSAKVLRASWRYKPDFYFFPYLRWKWADFSSSKLSLAYGVNVNHQQSVHINVYLLCMCGNREYTELLKQTRKLFFQMSAQVYSVPGQTEGRREAFLEWKSIDLSYELPLTCGGIISIIKMFIILRNIYSPWKKTT